MRALFIRMSADHPPICDYEDSDYQTSFWEQGERAYEDRVEEIALQRLLPAQGEMLLEVGAGAGRNTPRYGSFRQVALLDYSFSQLQQAQERLGRSERYIYVAADVYRLPFVAGRFETATMIRTLHHLVEPRRALDQIHQVLQQDGVFILEFANKQNLKAILRYLLRRQSWSPFTREPIEFAKLNFDFHPQAVQDWLLECGFKPERRLTVSHFRAGALKRWVPLEMLVWLDGLAQLTGDWWQLSPSVFERARAQGGSPAADHESLFRCPDCGYGPLENSVPEIACPACGRRYPVVDGIFDFRVRGSQGP